MFSSSEYPTTTDCKRIVCRMQGNLLARAAAAVRSRSAFHRFAALAQCRLEATDQLRLRRNHLDASGIEIEPRAPIHLGEDQEFSRSARPFCAGRVADHGVGIGIAFPRPRVNGLSRLLPDGAERNEGTVRHDRGLLLKLSTSRVEEILAFVDGAFRNRPRAVIAVCPERTAGMGKKDLEP